MPTNRVDSVVNLSKRRGFVFPSSEIYGGTRSAWDYGPLGVELKENIRRQWWQSVVRGRDDVVGLDSSVILAPQVWEASGHTSAFVDPLTECKQCHNRWRADQLIEAYEEKHGREPENGLADIVCPNCGSTDVEPCVKGKKPAIVVLLLLGFALFSLRRGIKCKACGEFSATQGGVPLIILRERAGQPDIHYL